MITKEVLEINRKLFYELWNLADNSKLTTELSPRLIFPKKRDEEIRISEQESRVLLCGLLNNSNYFYSVETPTEELYKQKGKTHRSASSDLSLYIQTNNKTKKVLNVELKAHNPRKENIRKDIEKLMREDVPGNWFHTLKNIDRRTLLKIFNKIAGSIKDCKKNGDENNLSIIFSFCVLEQQWGCIKHFDYKPEYGEFNEYVDNFFALEYCINKSEIVIGKDAGWEIVEQY
jgi:hypothetical protein